MADRWLRTNSLLASTVAFWLSALSPLPKIGRGISYGLALVAGVQLVQESRRLMVDEARRAALRIMNTELEQTEIALHHWQQEEALKEIYGALTYPPEVETELKTSLEHLYKEPSGEHPQETSAYTSNKSYYLAIKSILEARGETFVIEQILKMGGRHWAEGKALLQQILEEGKANGW